EQTVVDLLIARREARVDVAPRLAARREDRLADADRKLAPEVLFAQPLAAQEPTLAAPVALQLGGEAAALEDRDVIAVVGAADPQHGDVVVRVRAPRGAGAFLSIVPVLVVLLALRDLLTPLGDCRVDGRRVVR